MVCGQYEKAEYTAINPECDVRKDGTFVESNNDFYSFRSDKLTVYEFRVTYIMNELYFS